MEVAIGKFKSLWILRNRATELSNTLTTAPNAIAERAAYSATVPAPIITTRVGLTPGIPPMRRPLPSESVLNNSAAISIDEVPAISPIDLTKGKTCASSLI